MMKGRDINRTNWPSISPNPGTGNQFQPMAVKNKKNDTGSKDVLAK